MCFNVIFENTFVWWLINLSILILNSSTLYVQNVPLKEINILNKPPPLMNSKLRKAVFKKVCL